MAPHSSSIYFDEIRVSAQQIFGGRQETFLRTRNDAMTTRGEMLNAHLPAASTSPHRRPAARRGHRERGARTLRGPGARDPVRSRWLDEVHVFGLQAFRPLLYFKGYARTLVE